jgi:hypothetical protein
VAEVLNAGAHTSITWTATDNAAGDDGRRRVVARRNRRPVRGGRDRHREHGSYDWLVTLPITTNAFVRVTAHDAAANNARTCRTRRSRSRAAPRAGRSDHGRGARAGVAEPRARRAAVHDRVAGGGARAPRAAGRPGREVSRARDGVFAPGRHTFRLEAAWTPTQVTPGLYFVRLTVPGRSLTQRFALVH